MVVYNKFILESSASERTDDILFLENNIEPFEEVVIKWQSTFNERCEILSTIVSTASIFSRFPILKEAHALTLVINLFLKLILIYFYTSTIFIFRLPSIQN